MPVRSEKYKGRKCRELLGISICGRNRHFSKSGLKVAAILGRQWETSREIMGRDLFTQASDTGLGHI